MGMDRAKATSTTRAARRRTALGAGRALLSALLLLVLLLPLGPHALANNSAVQNVRNSVVRVVNVPFVDGYPVLDYMSHGTGIVVGSGSKQYVLTNRHVVEWQDVESALREMTGSVDISVQIYILTGSTTMQSYTANAQNIKLSASDDLALVYLKSKLSGREPAVFGSSSDIKVTDAVYAIGFPSLAEGLVDRNLHETSSIESLLKQVYPSDIEDMTVTNGTVSKKDVKIDGSIYIQHEANISPGNSGGPLVDEYGHVVGINTLITTNSEIASKTHYAIDVSTMRRFLEGSNVTFSKGTVLGGVVHKYLIWIIVAAVALLIVRNRLKKSGAAGGAGPAAAPAQPKTLSDVMTRIYSSPDSDKLMVLTNSDFFVEQLKKYYRPEFKADCQLLEKASQAGLGKIIIQYQNQSAIPGDSDKQQIISEMIRRCGFTPAQAARTMTLFFQMVGWDGSVPKSAASAGTAASGATGASASAGASKTGTPVAFPDMLRAIYTSADRARLMSDPDYFMDQLKKYYRPEYKANCQLLEKAARSGLGSIVQQYIQQHAEPSDSELAQLVAELCKRSGFSGGEANRAIEMYGRMVGWSRYGK